MAFPFALLAAGVSAGGSILGGIAANNAAKLNAFNIQTEKAVGEAQALQRHNDRLDLYRSNLSANIASLASQGRDIGSDMSVTAFLENQKDIATTDTARSDFMASMQGMSLDAKAAAVRSEGKAQLASGIIGALGTMASGLGNYQDTKIGGGKVSGGGKISTANVSGRIKSSPMPVHRPRSLVTLLKGY